MSLSASAHRPLQILSLSRYCMQSEHRTVYLDNKVAIFYKNIGHITVTPICSNKGLLIVDIEFFLSLRCQHPGNFVPTNHPTVGKSSRWIVSFPICKSFKHNVGTELIDKQTTWKPIWRRYKDKIKVKVP